MVTGQDFNTTGNEEEEEEEKICEEETPGPNLPSIVQRETAGQ